MSTGDPARRSRPRIDLDELLGTFGGPAADAAKSVVNALEMSFVLVPDGRFRMGADATEAGFRANEAPARDVAISRPFYLAVHPVTQRAYSDVMGVNPARHGPDVGGGPDLPVENVSWEDATAFCERLSALMDEKRAGRRYRLPTEAEWEYACRAGSRTATNVELTAAAANFAGGPGSPGRPTAVGTYPANRYGLFDVHGNVWEWCADWYAEFGYNGAADRDPSGPPTGRLKVLRGGSWRNQAGACRSAYRNALAPYQKDSTTGFRPVLVVG